LASLKEMSKEEFEKFTERFEKVYSILRGRVDMKSRLMLLLDPDKVETSTRLSRGQIQFVALAYSAAEQWDFFEPLKSVAEHICLASISYEGKGREESIRFAGALAESKLLQKMGLIKERSERELQT